MAQRPRTNIVTYEELVTLNPLPVLVLRRQPGNGGEKLASSDPAPAVLSRPAGNRGEESATRDPPAGTSWTFPPLSRIVKFIVKVNQEAKEKLDHVLPGADEKQAAKSDQGKNCKVVVQKIFGEMKSGLNGALGKAMEEAMGEMDNMTEEQQEQVLFFWDQMGDFIMKLLDWVDRMFDKIVQKIQEGYSIDRNATAKLFKSMSDALEESLNSAQD